MREKDIYGELVARYGDSHKSLNWGSRDSQVRRFEQLAAIGDLGGHSVLDVGCGLAHFADWLESAGVAVRYTGLDVTGALLDKARERDPRLELVEGDIADSGLMEGRMFDYVFASGIFTYIDGGQRTLEYIVRCMWDRARIGVAFNSLSARATERAPDEFHADQIEVESFCRSLTARVRMIDDYHPADFTCHLLKETV